MINLEAKNFIDYFALCGLDVKSGLESEPVDAYGTFQHTFKIHFNFHHL